MPRAQFNPQTLYLINADSPSSLINESTEYRNIEIKDV